MKRKIDNKQIAKNIKVLLAENSMTQLQLEKKMGVSHARFYKLMSGKAKWNIYDMSVCVDLFKKSSDDIFFGKVSTNGDSKQQINT